MPRRRHALLPLILAVLAPAAAAPAAGAFGMAEPDLAPAIPAAAISDGGGTIVWQEPDGSLRTLRDDQAVADAAVTPPLPAGCAPEIAHGAEVVARCEGTTYWNDRYFLVDPATGELHEDGAMHAVSAGVSQEGFSTPLQIGTQALLFATASFRQGADGSAVLTASRATGRYVAADAPRDSVPDLDQAKGWRRLCAGLHRHTAVDDLTGERVAWPALARGRYLLERDPASGQLWLRRCGQHGGGKLVGVAAGLDDVALRDRYLAFVADGGRTLVIRWLDGRRWVYRRPSVTAGSRLGAVSGRRLMVRHADGSAALFDLAG